ncbi:MAG: DEAD/DEAH box helicase [Acidiferrobacterales bacterium]|nr:DEAD/DEAH box helicase [Acidiferrobacterales bacterium]
MTEKHLTDQRFDALPLTESLQQGLKEAGFEFCTPIQAQSLPVALEGSDVAGQAQTGTGKTIAFLLACCNLLLTKEPLEGYPEGAPRALILAPTRELAIQIHKDAELLNKHTGLKMALVYGGTGYDQQKEMLAGKTDILIGTPGRLIDFFKQNLFTLKYAQVAVMDEADRMFDLGFIKDIRYLLRKMPEPENRLNLLYSATLSFRVMELAYEHMNDPAQIKIESDEVVADKIVERSFYPADVEKLPLLVNMLKTGEQERILVFVNTRHAAETVSNTLEANGFSCAMLSGDVPQNKRERLLEQFKNGNRKILVATDVAARGLHIPAVSHVFNFDLPQDAEDYVHRIGRTARAGASGEAISFICEKYAYSIMEIEEYIGHSLPRADIDSTMLEPIEIPPRRSRSRNDRADRGKHGQKRGPKQDKQRGNQKSGRKSADPSSPAQVQDQTPTPAPKVAAQPDFGDQSVPAQTREVNTNDTEPMRKQADTNPEEPRPSRPMIIPADPDLPTRFSRKFGEVPAVG